MQHSNSIREQLRPHLGWHGARLSFVALFIIALFRAKTVNLAELAFEALCPGVKIAYLTGDREFVGKPWLSFLMLDEPIRFRLRIRQTDKISRGTGQPAIAGAHLFGSLTIG
ncbi:IS4 family transposase, partial [Roseofilum sp. BLCC_M143]|nr:IS4 family transposase [Roseofilum casamattae BLCC-M143]